MKNDIEGKRGRGRPKKRGLDMIENIMRIAGIAGMWKIEINGGLGQGCVMN